MDPVLAAAAVAIVAGVNSYEIKCSEPTNYDSVGALLIGLCHDDFVLDTLTATRTKGIYKGKCVWNANYQIVNGTLLGKQNFLAAAEKLVRRIPIGAEVVSRGRYYGKNFGISIQLGCRSCVCPSDFHDSMTLFDSIEQRNQENWIIIEPEMWDEILLGETDSNIWHVKAFQVADESGDFLFKQVLTVIYSNFPNHFAVDAEKKYIQHLKKI